MPASQDNYNKIEEYKNTASSKTQQAGQATATSFSLHDNIMNAVRADNTERGVSKLATDMGNVMGQMESRPADIRDQTRGIVDPFSVNTLTSNARAQNLNTLGTVSTQLSQNQGTLEEVITAGANQLKSKATKLMAEAESAMAEAETLQGEWDRMFQEKQLQEQIRQYDQSRQDKLNASGGGSTRETNFSDFADDGLGFSADIKSGSVTWEQAYTSLKGAYPWASDEEIFQYIGNKEEEETPSYGKPTAYGSAINASNFFKKFSMPTPQSVVEKNTTPGKIMSGLSNFFTGGQGRSYTTEEINSMTPEERRKLGL